MNGAGHFGRAEDLLVDANRMRDEDRPAETASLLAEAQVHATLALAAAVAAPVANQHRRVDDVERDERLWADVTAPGPRFDPPLPAPSAYHPYLGVPVR